MSKIHAAKMVRGSKLHMLHWIYFDCRGCFLLIEQLTEFDVPRSLLPLSILIAACWIFVVGRCRHVLDITRKVDVASHHPIRWKHRGGNWDDRRTTEPHFVALHPLGSLYQVLSGGTIDTSVPADLCRLEDVEPGGKYRLCHRYPVDW